MKILIVTCMLLVSFCQLFAQTPAPLLEKKKGLGTVFVQNDRMLTPKQLLEITRSNPEAYQEMRWAKNRYNVGQVFGMVGGAMVGFPLGTALGGGDPNWALAGIGAGLIGISIPFSVAYVKHARHAVSIYNQNVNQSGNANTELRFGMNYNGIGLSLTF